MMVFCVTKSGRKLMTYRMAGGHANHHPDAVISSTLHISSHQASLMWVRSTFGERNWYSAVSFCFHAVSFTKILIGCYYLSVKRMVT